MALKVLTFVNGRPLLKSGTDQYDNSFTVVSPIPSGTAVTLPNSQTYDSSELEIWLFGQRLTEVIDYNYVGSVPRTQVTFTFDLEVDDVIKFRIEQP